MRARTRIQKEVLELSRTLPALTESQKRWAKAFVTDKDGYYSNNKVWCQHCGYIEKVNKRELMVSIELESHPCSRCGTVLQLHNYGGRMTKRSEHHNKETVRILTTHGGWQVIRTLEVSRDNYYGEETFYDCQEVYQNWINEHGKEAILGRKHVRGPFHEYFLSASPLEIRQHNSGGTGYYTYYDAYDTSGGHVYPFRKVLPILKRNGWSGKLVKNGSSLSKLMQALITDRNAEILAKHGQYSLLNRYVGSGSGNEWMKSVKVLYRAGYIVRDAGLWIDYYNDLLALGLDVHNPHYICPENLHKAHQHYGDRIRRMRNAEEKARKMAALQEQEDKYRKTHGAFFGIHFDDGKIYVHVLSSVKEIAEEGDSMHHCVYHAEYYKREYSLILGARDGDGNRLETVEIDLRNGTVVQSRGLQNGKTEYHDRIISLVNKNMSTIMQTVRRRENASFRKKCIF